MVVVFNTSKASVPNIFKIFNDVDDVIHFIKNEKYSLNDVFSIPHGENGKKIVKAIANKFANGSSVKIMPVINIHSGNELQKQELSDFVSSYRKLFNDNLEKNHFVDLLSFSYEKELCHIHDKANGNV